MAKKKATKYALNIDEFDSVVSEYVKDLDGFELKQEIQQNAIVYQFVKKGETRPTSFLHCYNTKGKSSFLVQGKQKDIAAKCRDLLIEKTRIEIGEKKSFSIKPASEEDIEVICQFLSEECDCIIKDISCSDSSINSAFIIEGKHNDTIRLTHYKTGTLLVQGRCLFTFASFISIAFELFNPTEVKKEHFKIFDISDTNEEIISTNLSSHLPNAYGKIGNKLDAIMAPSLILLNSPKELTDYTAYAFPVLRGVEGILKKTFIDQGIPIEKTFKEYFRCNDNTGQCEWAKSVTGLFPNEELRKTLLALYRFYHAERHTLFHINATIEDTRTLQYSDAVELIERGLKLIDKVYIHLN
ncbi:hypothetical protein EYV94_12925 [Puteibacter caeruleilacunae]|nr:hypothetical protein EYV94_12925 [Puteibacter caeruleilacunae]